MKNQLLYIFKIGLSFILVVFIVIMSKAQKQQFVYSDSWAGEGFSIESQTKEEIKINYSVVKFLIKTDQINGESIANIEIAGKYLPNNLGCPDLPSFGRYFALPQGAVPKLNIISMRTDTIRNLNIGPANEIPFETAKNVERTYNKNLEVYTKNAFYPSNPILLSEPGKIRGVDVVMIGVTPFQYNPVTKELIVIRDIKMEISYEGGNGQYGDVRYRSRWWDPILEDALLNYSALPIIDYSKKDISKKEDGYEYLIVTPNDAVFQQWADSIKKFRTEQGILTGIIKLSDIPNSNTAEGLKTYFNDIYNNWNIPPSAILLLADYGTNPNSTIISKLYNHPATYPDFASDNYFADVDGDDLPDIVFARIPANNAVELQTMVSKFINFERNPPMDPDFYDQPVTSYIWQENAWFALGTEIIGGFFRNNGKHPARIFAFTPTATWSTATNTDQVINYFGPTGLNYIPDTPAGITGQGGLIDSINDGTFMLLYRGHGDYNGWSEPSFTSTQINSLTNVDNKLPFVFSIASQTGAYHLSYVCFSEKFHRYTFNGQNSGALGLVAASEVTYSFVNEVFTLGMFDNMWPDFMPGYNSVPSSRGALPAFGCTAGKYYLSQSGWPYNTSNKQITYRLFHMQGDAFLTMYSEVPQDLVVSHLNSVPAGTTVFSVTADEGSFIALTVNGQILGTANGTGSPVAITLNSTLTSNNTMVVTVTKQNYKRYKGYVAVPVNINENLNENFNFFISPNPNNGIFKIISDGESKENYNLKVINSLNMVLFEMNNIFSNGKHIQSIDMTNFPSGLYYLVVENKHKKIIKKFSIIK